MPSHRIGLYIEVTAPGVDATDSVHRAVHALERMARTGIPVYASLTETEPMKDESGEPVFLDLHHADGVEPAALNGRLMVVPRSRVTELLRRIKEAEDVLRTGKEEDTAHNG